MTPPQLDESANAPWTKTIVGLAGWAIAAPARRVVATATVEPSLDIMFSFFALVGAELRNEDAPTRRSWRRHRRTNAHLRQAAGERARCTPRPGHAWKAANPGQARLQGGAETMRGAPARQHRIAGTRPPATYSRPGDHGLTVLSGIRAMTLISKSNPASQFTPIAVQVG